MTAAARRSRPYRLACLLSRRVAGRPREGWRLAGPVVLQEAALVAASAAVLWMASRSGAETVAAIGMMDQLGYLLHSLFGSLAIGVTVATAHGLGAGREGELRSVARAGLVLAFGAASALAVLLWFSRSLWIRWCLPGAEPAVVEQADLYFRWLLVADIPSAGVLVACGVLRGMRRTSKASKVNVAMNITHVALAAVLMLGLQWGAQGAGIALLSARTVGCLLALAVLASGLPAGAAGVPDAHLGTIWRVAWPAAVESGLFQVGKLMTQAMVATLGTAALAANFIAFSVAGLMNIPGTALGVAATTVVGHRLGAGHPTGAKRMLRRLVLSATVVLSAMGAIVLPLSAPLAALFGAGAGAEVTRTAALLIALNCLLMPAWGLSFVLPAGLRGAGDTRYAMQVAVAGMWLFRIGSGYLLGIVLGWGVVGIWMGMFADWLARGAFFWRRLSGKGWLTHRVLD